MSSQNPFRSPPVWKKGAQLNIVDFDHSTLVLRDQYLLHGVHLPVRLRFVRLAPIAAGHSGEPAIEEISLRPASNSLAWMYPSRWARRTMARRYSDRRKGPAEATRTVVGRALGVRAGKGAYRPCLILWTNRRAPTSTGPSTSRRTRSQ